MNWRTILFLSASVACVPAIGQTTKSQAEHYRTLNADAPNHPEASGCLCCLITWNRVKSHPTNYARRGNSTYGCLALCELCWKSRTPRQRLPYYRKLWERWRSEKGRPWTCRWEVLEYAVLNEERPTLRRK